MDYCIYFALKLAPIFSVFPTEILKLILAFIINGYFYDNLTPNFHDPAPGASPIFQLNENTSNGTFFDCWNASIMCENWTKIFLNIEVIKSGYSRLQEANLKFWKQVNSIVGQTFGNSPFFVFPTNPTYSSGKYFCVRPPHLNLFLKNRYDDNNMVFVTHPSCNNHEHLFICSHSKFDDTKFNVPDSLCRFDNVDLQEGRSPYWFGVTWVTMMTQTPRGLSKRLLFFRTNKDDTITLRRTWQRQETGWVHKNEYSLNPNPEEEGSSDTDILGEDEGDYIMANMEEGDGGIGGDYDGF